MILLKAVDRNGVAAAGRLAMRLASIVFAKVTASLKVEKLWQTITGSEMSGRRPVVKQPIILSRGRCSFPARRLNAAAYWETVSSGACFRSWSSAVIALTLSGSA